MLRRWEVVAVYRGAVIYASDRKHLTHRAAQRHRDLLAFHTEARECESKIRVRRREAE